MGRQRRINRIITVPPLTPGFVGPGHLAAQVVSPEQFEANDPFIALMDDHLDIGTRPVGGPHPQAGFETVTLIMEGSIRDRDEGGVIDTGEVQWMTAGRGIIHGENVEAQGKVRLLQLWLTLPKNQRWTTPRFQDIHRESIPIRREDGVVVRLYSGTSGDLHSPTRNYVPVTLAEITIEAGRSFEQDLSATYNGFLYVISGSAKVGDAGTLLKTGQAGWLDRQPSDAGPQAPRGDEASLVRIVSGDEGVRLVLYAGEPQGDAIVSHGPFVGDSREDIVRLYDEYRSGHFERLSELARAARAG